MLSVETTGLDQVPLDFFDETLCRRSTSGDECSVGERECVEAESLRRAGSGGRASVGDGVGDVDGDCWKLGESTIGEKSRGANMAAACG
jgi:hypothetical protein